MMSTLVKQSVISLFVNMNILGNQYLLKKEDATAIKKHCHKHGHTADTFCFSLVQDFSLVQNVASKYHLKLKESLLILKNETIPQRS